MDMEGWQVGVILTFIIVFDIFYFDLIVKLFKIFHSYIIHLRTAIVYQPNYELKWLTNSILIYSDMYVIFTYKWNCTILIK